MPDLPFGLNITPTTTATTTATTSPSTATVQTIGQGITSPFRRSANDIVTAKDIALLKNHMKQIIGTRANSSYGSGELPWRQSFGSLLHLLRHRNNGIVTEELARIYVVEAIARWSPRVIVRDVKITKEIGPDANIKERPILLIRITFDIRAIRGSTLVSQGETLDIAA